MESIRDLPDLFFNKLAKYHIRSLFTVPNSTNCLYFETDLATNVRSAINEIWSSPIQIHSITSIPLKDVPKLLKSIDPSSGTTLHCNSWVRLRRGGKYKGDLAFVDSADSNEGNANLLLIPRLPSLTNDIIGRKRKRKNAGFRHSPSIFDSSITLSAYENHDARDVTHLDPPVSIDENTWSYNNEILYKGLCRLTVPTLSLNMSPVEPSMNELTQWMQCAHEPIRQAIGKWKNNIDSAGKRPLCSGDHVLIKSNEEEHTSGIIVFMEDDNQLQTPPMALVRVDVTDAIQPHPIADLEKKISVGDFMSVEGGIHAGAKGTVISKDNATVTLLLGVHDQVEEVSSFIVAN